ncbi:MAG: insulinase family protein [Acidobacteriia bacterium]|nr:insulinase family protein [Terriglobia bacterium]
MQPRRVLQVGWIAVSVLLIAAIPTGAQDLAAFEKKLTEHKLANGLTLLIYQRPTAPVVSFFTYAEVGSAQEVPGITGIAHMFEHMAFKGTTQIGTNDWAGEKKALAAVDEAYHAYDRERHKVGGPDAAKLEELKKAWKDAQDAADKYIVKNEFGEIIDREGGVGMNAGTSADQTVYFYSLPANKVELWAYLESERFLDPVFREFYKERDVVMEERRLRTDSQPTGRLIEQFESVAFAAHPYHHPVVGYMSDLMSFSREDADQFRRTYYVPNNLVISIVGDVEPAKIIPILDKYFGRLPAAPPPPVVRTEEPKQIAEKTIALPDKSQPIYIEGYHRPATTDPDDAVYTAISDVLSRGRSSRLIRSLVRDKKVAAQAAAISGFPGEKYPSLMLFFAVPTPGHTNEEVQKALREEIEKLKGEPVTDEELKRVKTRAKADLIRGMQSNQGIADQLATYQALYGDWRELFHAVEKIDKVTKDDIQRVARAAFVPTNRTVGMIVNSDSPSAKN